MIRRSIFIVALVWSVMAMAGGWPKPKGKGYYKLSYSWLNGTEFFDGSGTRVPLERSLLFSTTSFYGEYGVTDRLTAIAYVPFATTARLEGGQGLPETSVTTIGDTNVGFRYGLITGKPNVLSASLTLGLPFGQIADPNSSEEQLQTGDGEFNQMIKIESGHSLKNGFYASSFVGLNFRSNGFSEEIRVGAEIGHVGESLIGIIKVQSITSLMNGDNEGTASSDLFNNNLEFFSLAPEIAYKVSEKWGLSFNYTMYLFGSKTLANPNATIGIYMDL